MLTKEEMMNFKWIKPNGDRLNARKEKDVCITKQNAGFAITFKNASFKRLGDKFGRIELAIVNEDVIAFRTSANGYKLTTKNKDNPNSRTVVVTNAKFTEQEYNVMMDLIGNYDLQYDNTFKMFYIKREAQDDRNKK